MKTEFLFDNEDGKVKAFLTIHGDHVFVDSQHVDFEGFNDPNRAKRNACEILKDRVADTLKEEAVKIRNSRCVVELDLS